MQLAQKDWDISTNDLDAVVVYILAPILPAVEQALINYAEQGERLLVVHHSLASAKMQNPRWLDFLGVRILPATSPDAP